MKNLTTSQVLKILKEKGKVDRNEINNLDELHIENLSNWDIPVYWDKEDRFLILDDFSTPLKSV